MSANTLVMTLVSGQTMPNIQFLKWFFRNNPQKADILFVSTEKMEESHKSEHIKDAVERLLQWFSSPVVIKVNENDFEDIKRKISEKAASEAYDRIVADITNGTKLMCLGMYEACKEMPCAEIYYQLLGSNKLQKIYPAQESYEIADLLTLEEYMKGCGVTCVFDNKTLKDYDFNKSVYENVIKDQRELISKLVDLQNTPYFKNIFKRKDSVDISSIEEEKLSGVNRDEFCELIAELGFDCTKLTRTQLAYITGGWFEEFVYQKIKEERGLKDENIALNAEIGKGGDKYELDVVFLDDGNRLNVIECKSFMEDTKLLKETLNKLDGIMNSKFGLNATSYLYTKSKIEKPSILNKAKEFGIKIVDGAALCNGEP